MFNFSKTPLLLCLAAVFCASATAAATTLTAAAQQPDSGNNNRAASGDSFQLEADALRSTPQRVQMLGEAKARFGEYELCAGAITYERDEKLLHATDNIRLSRHGTGSGGGELTRHGNNNNAAELTADALRYSLTENSGQLDNFTARPGGSGLRIDGEQAIWREQRITAKNASVTSCPSDNPDWRLSGGSIENHPQRQEIITRDVFLYIGGVPVFYLPRGVFYYGKENRSGFLWGTLKVGDGDYGGSLPYYIALAKNYDLTIVPNYRSQYGLELGGDFRFLTLRGGGGINIATALFDERGGRGHEKMHYQHAQDNWRLDISAENTSDDDYLQNYGGSEEKALRNLPRRAALSYARGNFSARAALEDYKTLDDSLIAPHRLAPQLDAELYGGGREYFWTLAAQYSRFIHAQKNRRGTSGGRGVLRGEARATRYWRDVLFSPGIGAHAVQYTATENGKNGSTFVPHTRLDIEKAFFMPLSDSSDSSDNNDSNDSDNSNNGGADSNNSAGRYSHLRLQGAFLYAPARRRQNALPLYDTTLRDINAENLSEWNRFIGSDRASDVKSFTYSGNYYVIDGRDELFYVGAAQRYNISDVRITLAQEAAPQTRGFGDIFFSSRLRLAARWKIAANAQWDAEEKSMTRFWAEIKGDLSDTGGDKRVYLRYFAEGDESLVVGGGAPAASWLDFAFQTDYLMDEDRFSNSRVSARLKDSCNCWNLSLSLTDTTTAEGDNDAVYLFGIEFVGLGKTGTDYEDLLNALK